ncbi:hypothetical protein, partial [Senegalimassilia anaerobia]|uniref:hypothetical protein n=1 Tax=Senegalimassilia anaerobia TaxID=1473216 RepID=UPI0026E9C0EE
MMVGQSAFHDVLCRFITVFFCRALIEITNQRSNLIDFDNRIEQVLYPLNLRQLICPINWKLSEKQFHFNF